MIRSPAGLVSDLAALIRSLLALRSDRRSGVLTIDAEGGRTLVYLREGVPVFAEEGSLGESLGRLLVRQKRLTQEQYTTVISKMTEALGKNEQLRFGRVAVELGYLTEKEVSTALGDQVRWRIVRALQREKMAVTFEESSSRLEGVGSFPMQIEALTLDAMRWIDDDRKREVALGRVLDDAMVVGPAGAATLASRADLTPAEAKLLAMLDGKRTIRAILAAREAKDVDAPAVLAALVLTRGVVQPGVAPPAAARAPEPAPASHRAPLSGPASTPRPPVVPTPADAWKLEPKSVPGRAVAAASPPPVVRTPADPWKPAGAPATPGKAAPVLRAQEILKALEDKRTKPDATQAPRSLHESRILAERALQDGLAHTRAGRWQQAAPLLAEACKLMPGSDEFKLYAKWSAIRARSHEPPHAVERAELKRIALAAVKADPNFAYGWYVAGAMCSDDGEDVQAYKFLSRAVKLDPDNLDAQRLVRVLDRRKQ
jgi:hypothetical protein